MHSIVKVNNIMKGDMMYLFIKVSRYIIKNIYELCR